MAALAVIGNTKVQALRFKREILLIALMSASSSAAFAWLTGSSVKRFEMACSAAAIFSGTRGESISNIA